MGDESDDVTLYPPWRQAAEDFRKAGFTYGDTIKRSWFYEAFGIEEPKPDTLFAKGERLKLAFVDQFEKLRGAILRDCKMDLACVPGVGYEILMPEAQTDEAFEDGVREVRKGLRRMGGRLRNVDPSRLTDEQRKKNHDAIAKLSMMAGMVKPSVTGMIE